MQTRQQVRDALDHQHNIEVQKHLERSKYMKQELAQRLNEVQRSQKQKIQSQQEINQEQKQFATKKKDELRAELENKILQKQLKFTQMTQSHSEQIKQDNVKKFKQEKIERELLLEYNRAQQEYEVAVMQHAKKMLKKPTQLEALYQPDEFVETELQRRINELSEQENKLKIELQKNFNAKKEIQLCKVLKQKLLLIEQDE
ncbi:Hypothetical_protein [Hexamita inflata]|uniref:Hypothetical_protein n=1 Tax=Hexamita inflata TaxID=28002 RepID=A0AA86RC15_9EUKA|nr:Hypothetical protein HINF_LOCUS58886 [Hexamita inflata]